jgi:hypothetical protein
MSLSSPECLGHVSKEELNETRLRSFILGLNVIAKIAADPDEYINIVAGDLLSLAGKVCRGELNIDEITPDMFGIDTFDIPQG